MKGLLRSVGDYSGFDRPIRSAYYALLVSLLASQGYSSGLLAALAPSCDGNESPTEKRKAKLVELYVDLIQSGVDPEEVFALDSCSVETIESINLPEGVVSNFGFTTLTGGSAVALDSLATAGMSDGTIVTVFNGSGLSLYRLSTATTAESSPSVIRPEDYSASNTRIWTLIGHNQSGFVDLTITATVGAVTISKHAGQAIIAAGASSVTVTNALVDTAADYIVVATLAANDATALYVRSVVKGTGSFVIHTNANATANLAVMWRIYRKLA